MADLAQVAACQPKSVLWLTGRPGSGKTTIAQAMTFRLMSSGARTILLDGDGLRKGLNIDLGFSDADRAENIRRIAHVARLFHDQGFIVLVAVIAPKQQHRDAARSIIGASFAEIFVRAPAGVCELRDPKGLYAKARRGEIANFTGVSSEYEEPALPDVVLDTGALSPEDCIGQLNAILEVPNGRY